MNKHKSISPISILISSLLFIILGCFVLFNPLYLESIISKLTSIFSMAMGALLIINYIFNKSNKHINSLLSGILYFCLGIFIKFLVSFIEISLVLIIGMYAFINFMAQFVSLIILYKNKVTQWKLSAIMTISSLLFSMILIFNPIRSKSLLSKIAGVYLILYGITMFRDFINEILDTNKLKDDMKRKVRITLPSIYTSFIPQKLLESINKSLATKSESVFVHSKSDDDGELEVFIHLGKECAKGFGHIDICFKDKIYCYGSYDYKSRKLYDTISEGVLIEVDRDKYIDFTTQSRCLVSFVLSLNSMQCRAIESKINELKNPCVRWKCDAELNTDKEYSEYVDLLYLNTNAKYYKFRWGYFKTYFVLGSNCVKLADTIIGSAGIDAISINGIITPGIYYDFLNKLFVRNNTIVIRRNVYNICKNNAS